MDPSLSISTRAPEIGSLETKYPGVTRQIYRIKNGPLAFFRWAEARPMVDQDAITFYAAANQLVAQLEKIPRQFNLSLEEGSRFVEFAKTVDNSILDSEKTYDSFDLTSAKIRRFLEFTRRLQASLFEFLVSNLIAGEAMFYEKDVFQFYSSDHLNTKISAGTGKTMEVDIIVQRKGARDLWVEVKNNSLQWTLEEYADWAGAPTGEVPEKVAGIYNDSMESRSHLDGQKIFKQLLQQAKARDALGLTDQVEIRLVTKFPRPIEEVKALEEIGILSWSVFGDRREFLPLHFQNLAKEIEP